MQHGPNESTALAMSKSSLCQDDEPSHKEPLKPAWLGLGQPGPRENTGLAVIPDHLLPTS